MKNNEKMILRKIWRLYKSGRRQKAKQMLQNFLELMPSSEMAWFMLAIISERKKERLHALKRTLEINPNNEKAQAYLLKLLSTPDKNENLQKQFWLYAIGLLVGLFVLCSMIYFGRLAFYSLEKHRSTSSNSQGPFTLPPTWTPSTPRLQPTRTKRPTATPFLTPTSVLCPPDKVTEYRDQIYEIVLEIYIEIQAVDEAGGYFIVLQDSESALLLAQRNEQHVQDAQKIDPPPCLQSAHYYFIKFLEYRQKGFMSAAVKDFEASVEWMEKSNDALEKWEDAMASVPED